jgi:hypothetical protein
MYYTVSLLFKGSSASDDDPLWEESIRLIEADGEDQARGLALEIGKQNELSYAISSGDSVCWKFMQIERIYLVEDDISNNGVELFSRFLRDSEVASILQPFED